MLNEDKFVLALNPVGSINKLFRGLLSFTFRVTLTSLNRSESTIIALKSGNRVRIEDITGRLLR